MLKEKLLDKIEYLYGQEDNSLINLFCGGDDWGDFSFHGFHYIENMKDGHKKRFEYIPQLPTTPDFQ